MRAITCLYFALATVCVGAVLRLAVPVAPVDDTFRDVIRFYRSLELH